jgi:site-specific DNA recombinase
MTYLPPPSTLPPGSVVDSYRRDSGGSKQDQSTGQQLNEITAYCLKHGLVLHHNFIDEARSGGSTAGRDDFNRMIDLYRIPEERPHGLILWNYARFARDFDNAVYFKSLIRTYKIVIHSLNDQIPEGDYGRIVEFFIDMSNEEKRRQTSADAKRGLRELVQKYGCVPGTPPRGFIREPVHLGERRDHSEHIAHRWAIDKTLAPVIKKAFQMRAAKCTLKAIHAETHLYTSYSSYKSFFTNPIYIGVLEFGDLVIENYCPPLVAMDTWNKVQSIVTQYAAARNTERHPRRANSVYLLSGLLKCAQCGSPMNGNTVSHQRITGRDEAYRCSKSMRTDQCNAGRISRRKLEEKVIATLKDVILIPENIEAIHSLSLAAQIHFEHGRNQRRAVVDAQKKKLSLQIANITKAIAEHGHNQALLEKLTELTSLRAQAMTELTGLNLPLQPLPPLSTPQIVTLANGLQGQMSDHTQPERIRAILKGFVIEIRAERVGKQITGTIRYRYPMDESLPIGLLSVGAHLK